ncbi:ATPase [Cognatishimia activa]|uniref:ATPase n=1 Tax=Cognatishimia activa TaxID=1715691 RepID=UPI00223019DB|nr:ATPase [Cognatishimia activa]UZD91962.1 ATPase [Cognatishimia activa]
MIYKSADDWRNAKQKKVLLFAMSGLGKTHLSNMLRDTREWFHYSIDYRIGTRYMGEHIADNAKAEAMKVPFLRELLLTDSIYIGSNITFNNLNPLSTYLGKPGNPEKGGVAFDEYMRRQDLHREAEISALLDTAHFINRARALYGYDNFICDTGGSICEVVDPDNPDDPVLNALSENTLMVWIKGSEAHSEELIRRFDKSPKPMYYQPEFLHARWSEFLAQERCAPEDVDPDAFVRFAYAKALAHRQPRYEAMSKWGITVDAKEVSKVTSASDFDALIADALERT